MTKPITNPYKLKTNCNKLKYISYNKEYHTYIARFRKHFIRDTPYVYIRIQKFGDGEASRSALISLSRPHVMYNQKPLPTMNTNTKVMNKATNLEEYNLIIFLLLAERPCCPHPNLNQMSYEG